MGHVQDGQVPLDDAAAELGVERLREAPEEALTGVLVQVYVAGVGAREANVAGDVIFRVPPVFTNRYLAEQVGLSDPVCPARDFVLTREL
jgi:hypothetical protein